MLWGYKHRNKPPGFKVYKMLIQGVTEQDSQPKTWDKKEELLEAAEMRTYMFLRRYTQAWKTELTTSERIKLSANVQGITAYTYGLGCVQPDEVDSNMEL